MTLRYMKIFISVYEQQNITYAANNLHMTQPAVSRAVSEIESHYCMKLFIRQRKGISPTEAGDWLYEQAKNIVDSFDKMESLASDLHNNNTLRIDCCALLGQTYMPWCVSRFNKLYPHLPLKVTISRNSDNILSALEHKKIDMAILDTILDSNDFLVKKLFQYNLVPLFPPRHPLAEKKTLMLEDMESCFFICTESGRPLRRYLEQVFHVHGMKFEPQWECVSSQGIINAVSQGHGIAFLPLFAVKNALRDGLVASRSIDNEPFLRYIYITYPKEHLSSQAQTLLKFIISDSNFPEFLS